MFRGGTGHYKRERIHRRAGREAAQHFVAPLIGEEQFPANAVSAIQDGRRRRRNLEAIAVATNKGAAADMTLDQPFRFELRIGVRNGGAVNTEHCREFAASGNAVAGPQIAGVHKRAQLIAKLDIERNVTLGLEMNW